MPENPSNDLLRVLAQRQAAQQQHIPVAPPMQGLPQVPMAPTKIGGFQFQSQGEDPEGLAKLLANSGMQGSRTSDINLASPQMSMDEMIRRVDMIMGKTGQ